MKLKKSSLPLYYQLEKVLRKRILSGHFKSGECIPTERDLCEEFGVSRITVRQALAKLEDLDLVRREQGRGTFVTPRTYSNTPYKLYGYMEDLFSMGETTRLNLTSKKLVQPDSGIAKEMNLSAGEMVFLFEGVRKLDKHTQAYFEAYTPRSIGEKVRMEDVDTPFLISHVEKAASDRAVSALQVISAKAASPKLASIMQVKARAPLLVIKRIYFTAEERVLELAITYCPGEAYQSVARLETVPTSYSDE